MSKMFGTQLWSALMTMDIKSQLKNDIGVTLVEVLVSFALLSVLSVLLLSGLRQAATTSKVSQDAQSRADTRFALDHMADVLRSVIALKGVDSSGNPTPIISGTSNQMQFYTVSDGTVLTGGIYQLHWLERELDNEPNSLFEEWRVIANPASGALQKWFSKPVVENLDTVKFRYLAPVNGASNAVWQNNWSSTKDFPVAVEIIVSQSINGRLQTFSRVVQMSRE